MYRGPYRCSTVSLEGLVQQIAVSYLRHGYWWYVTGTIPEGKDPIVLDTKLIQKYGIDTNERERAFRKRSGRANMQYIRHDRFYVLLCTEGEHPFKQAEAETIRDARKAPILIPKQARRRKAKRDRAGSDRTSARNFEGYAVSYRKGHYVRKSEQQKVDYRAQRVAGGRPSRGRRDDKWHARVEIERRTFKMLRAYFLNRASKCSVDTLTVKLQAIPYEPYAPVRQQLLSLVRDINKSRKIGGAKGQVSYSSLTLKRTQIHPFGNAIDGGVSRARAA